MREVERAWKKDVTLKEALRTMMPQLGQNSTVVGKLEVMRSGQEVLVTSIWR